MGGLRARRTCATAVKAGPPILLALALALQMRRRGPNPAPAFQMCHDPFFVNVRNTTNTPHEFSTWPCYVPPPERYSVPYKHPEALWKLPRPNLGMLNYSNPEHNLHLNLQRWARMDDDNVYVRAEGGTSGRAFRDNFEYVQILLNSTKLNTRCGKEDPPIMLDMGGGIGSVAAAFLDRRGADKAIRTLSYVWPDNYLRLQTMMSERGLPSYIANFTGSLPFPNQSFDFVHCKWCWHHVVGYDIWLNAVNRVLVPGGFFIHTLSKAKSNDQILEWEEWDAALARQPFRCYRERKIIVICQKRWSSLGNRALKPSRHADYCPQELQSKMKLSLRRTDRFANELGLAIAEVASMASNGNTSHRLLNVNCPDVVLCQKLEAAFGTTSVLHIGSNEHKREIAQLLLLRSIAMLHDWEWNVPVYPRSYDVINVGCSRKTRKLLSNWSFLLDLHRILRPNGTLMFMRSFCSWDQKQVTSMLTKSSFSVRKVSLRVLVAQRLPFDEPKA